MTTQLLTRAKSHWLSKTAGRGRPYGHLGRLTVIVLMLSASSAFAQSRVKLSELGQTKTTMFGVEAQGSSFVYVLDRSASMGDPGGRPMRAAKDELLRSLEALTDVQQFQLIFYNQFQSAFQIKGQEGRLIFGNAASKEAARNFVEKIEPAGATRHVDALVLAVKLAPDAIFVLTDGDSTDDMTDEEVARVIKLNTGGARIYVIQCSPPAQNKTNHLIKLAEQSAGKHVYIDLLKKK